MSVCSAHREPLSDCPRCQASPQDLFPDWDEKVAEAEKAGLMVCQFCH